MVMAPSVREKIEKIIEDINDLANGELAVEVSCAEIETELQRSKDALEDALESCPEEDEEVEDE